MNEQLQKRLAEIARQPKQSNRIKPPTPKQAVMRQFSPVVGEPTATGTALTVKDILKKVCS